MGTLGRLARLPASTGAAVAHRVDELASAGLPWVVDAVFSRLDVTDLVIKYVDLDRIVASVDLDAAAHRLDLLGLAQYVIDGVDLPSIVRSSSASITSETVHGLRVHGVEADQAVSRVIDHFIPRRRSANGDREAPVASQPDATQ